jgi:homocysteine S-methyltransferase
MHSLPTRAAEFREMFLQKHWTADGAMATRLLAKGAPPHHPVEELNLRLPALVRDVHREYLSAGAEILRTNTFGANRLRLAHADLARRLGAINRTAARIAREAARGEAFVAGVLGPTGERLAPLGPLGAEAARAVFAEQAAALAGVDLFLLETFRDVGELEAAVQGVREAAGADIVVVAQVSIEEDGRLADGTPPERWGPQLEALAADAIGINCSAGPHSVFRALARLRAVTAKPLSLFPGAGFPAACDPEYFVRRFPRVRIAGGCCGTGPEHVAALRQAGFAESAAERRSVAVEVAEARPPKPLAERSRLGAKLAAGEFVRIFDLSEPDLAVARAAREAGFDAIGIPSRARLDPLAFGRLLPEMEVVLYTACRGRQAVELQSRLRAADALGLPNVLCVTGAGGGPVDIDAIGLVRIARGLNAGLDLGGNRLEAQTALTIGVAVDPGAADRERELARFEAKLRAGAEYAITQPVFDVASFAQLLRDTRSDPVPVIATVWLVEDEAELDYAEHELRIPVPGEFRKRVAAGEAGQATRDLAQALRPMAAGVRIVRRGAPVEAAFRVTLDSTCPRI